jgi:hypothetical protein
MKNQLVVRAAIGLFAIALLYLGYGWLKEWTKDPDLGAADTTDMIAAIEYVEGGSQAVVFDAKGKKQAVAWDKPANDTDPVWRPDGQRVFISSDRDGASHDIFRFNVATGRLENKLSGTRSASSPYFGPPGWPELADSGLITLGGDVFEFNQSEQRTRQLLPPHEFENVGDEEAGHLEALYNSIGLSFKSAKWGAGRNVMFTVMRREDDEVFVVNFMKPMGDQKVGPLPLLAGDNIQFDVAPDGTAVVSIQGFQYVDPSQVPPDYMIGGRAIKPWRNGLFAVAVDEEGHVAPMPIFLDQPDLGVQILELTAEVRRANEVPAGVNGVFVAEVGLDTAGELLELKPGDVIVSVAGKPVTNQQELAAAMSQVRLSIPVDIGVWSKASKSMVTHSYAFGREGSLAMRDPAVSPDSKSVAVVVGMVVDQFTFKPYELLIAPLEQGGIGRATRLLTGQVSEPNWHPNGKKLVFTMVGPSGDSQIYTINSDGSGQRNVSGAGEFASPKFSPMNKGS